jgi:DNA gyrase subunit A
MTATATDVVCVVTATARALICKVDEIPELANPGRGVIVIKADAQDAVVGFAVARQRDKEMLIAETDAGKKIPIGSGRPSITARGGKGHTLARKTKIERVILPEPPPLPTLLN